MKQAGVWILAIGLLGGFCAVAQPGAITIKAAKKVAGSRDGGNITGGKNIDLRERDLYYEFAVRSMVPQSSELTVEWVILVETMKGRLRVVSEGNQSITLKPGETSLVETPLFALRSESGPKGSTAKGEIEGCAVRVTDSAGNLVGVLYEPESRRKQLDEAFHGKVRKRKAL